MYTSLDAWFNLENLCLVPWKDLNLFYNVNNPGKNIQQNLDYLDYWA